MEKRELKFIVFFCVLFTIAWLGVKMILYFIDSIINFTI